ncbi:MAG: PqqD family peptide modification chaperone [Candidatus Aminicenantes bacterium]|nr:PqqD family peptide modification chaperone [Candidatus Aminicenantes bacterium]
MPEKIRDQDICIPSPDVVARDIEGELIIVPLTSGIGDMEDELFTLNQTGKAVWEKMDGHRTVEDIASFLSGQYNAEPGEIKEDVTGLLEELLRRKIIVKKQK